MNRGNEMGGAATPPATIRFQAYGQIGRYHGPTAPYIVVRFISDGQRISTKGKRAAFLLALMAAGSDGVAHVEVMPWLINAADAAKALRGQGVRIETRRGKPSRWILRSQVREMWQ